MKYSAEQKCFTYDTYFTEFFMEKMPQKISQEYPDITVPCKEKSRNIIIKQFSLWSVLDRRKSRNRNVPTEGMIGARLGYIEARRSRYYRDYVFWPFSDFWQKVQFILVESCKLRPFKATIVYSLFVQIAKQELDTIGGLRNQYPVDFLTQNSFSSNDVCFTSLGYVNNQIKGYWSTNSSRFSWNVTISLSIMALGLWPLFQFLNLCKGGRTPWTGDQTLPTHRLTLTE
jgi:hypothetical protein